MQSKAQLLWNLVKVPTIYIHQLKLVILMATKFVLLISAQFRLTCVRSLVTYFSLLFYYFFTKIICLFPLLLKYFIDLLLYRLFV